jgi:hypothetical protein
LLLQVMNASAADFEGSTGAHEMDASAAGSHAVFSLFQKVSVDG